MILSFIFNFIVYWESGENCFSYSLSYDARKTNDIEFIIHLYGIVPENGERYLIFALVLFALIFPFTGIFLFVGRIENISYILNIIEMEMVLVLTLGITQFRAKLIKPKGLITLAVIFTALVSILNFWFLLK